MKTKFSKDDFKDLRYNVFLPDDVKFLDVYNELQKYPEFKIKFKYTSYKNGLKQELDITDKVHRYVFLLYQESVLNTLKTLADRKREAALLVGFEIVKEKNEEKFHPYVEELLLNKNDKIIHVILRACKVIHKPHYTNLLIYEETLDNLRRTLPIVDPTKADTIKKIIANINELSEQIEILTKKILNNNLEEVTLKNLYPSIDDDILGISPEEIAKALNDGTIEQIIPNPYN